MLIGVDSSAAGAEQAGDTTYLRELLAGLARIDRANQYRLYDARNHPFYSSLPKWFVHRQLPHPYSFRQLATLPLMMARDHVELVHTQYVLPTWIKTPAVVTIHDLHFEHFPAHYPTRDRWFLKVFVRRSARHADRIITGSQYARRDIHTWYDVPLGKIVVIPHGVSPRFRPEPDLQRLQAVRQKYGIAKPFVLFLGRLIDPRKNVRLLINAFLELDSALAQSYQLVIAGNNEGERNHRLMLQAQQQGGGRIIFPGFIDSDDLTALLSAAAALVYPSIFEGFGLPVLEAMACGTPVIASRATALPEVTGDAALLFDPNNENELVEAMRRLLSSSQLRAQLRELGLRRAAGYSWEACARQTLDVYTAAYQRRPVVANEDLAAPAATPLG